MGKIRTRIIGLEDVETKQKAEQKRRSDEKKLVKKKIRAQGLKGGERMGQVEVGEESIKKMEKAKKILEAKPSFAKASESREKKAKKIKMHVRGKKYQQAKKLVDTKKTYTLDQALKLLKKMKLSKFDESVELHLNVDQAGLKGEVDLPNSTGKTLRVRIVDDKVLADIEKGKLEFDLLVTHPSYMSKLAKFAKILGPKGLMPNPKAGTISPKPEEIAKKYEKGALRWKTEAKFPLIHQMIGKVSFEDKKLLENAEVFFNSVGKVHILSAYIKSTMSPSVKVDIEKI